jgi:phage-related protein
VETFTPPVNPSPDLGYEIEPRVLVAGFGDGYQQRAADGLNAMRRVYGDVSFENLTLAEADAITGFFAARAGVEAFWWTPIDSGEAGKYRCTRWARRRRTAQAYVFTATLEQVFDL